MTLNTIVNSIFKLSGVQCRIIQHLRILLDTGSRGWQPLTFSDVTYYPCPWKVTDATLQGNKAGREGLALGRATS